MREYNVEVTRDGRWWMIHVPEIDQLTQARRVGEIEDMARSLIAVSTDTALSEVRVHITWIDEVPPQFFSKLAVRKVASLAGLKESLTNEIQGVSFSVERKEENV